MPSTRGYFLNVRNLLWLFVALLLSQHTWALPATLEALSLNDSTKLSINLKDGKTKVFIFLSAKCPCSGSHEPLVAELSKQFSEFSFWGIHSNFDEASEFAKDHFAASRLPFPIIQDKNARIADEFNALKTPHAFIVDGQGEIIFSGGVTNSSLVSRSTKPFLKTALASTRDGKPPDPREARALGCVIARP